MKSCTSWCSFFYYKNLLFPKKYGWSDIPYKRSIGSTSDDPNCENKKRHLPGLRGREKDWNDSPHKMPIGSTSDDPNCVNKKRHPPGLRGREIGLWYAKRQTQSNKDDSNIPSFSMDANSVKEILSVLNSGSFLSSTDRWSSKIDYLPSKSFQSGSNICAGAEGGISLKEELDILERIDCFEESDFKTMYKKNILGNKRIMQDKSEDAPIQMFKFSKSQCLDEKIFQEYIQKSNYDRYNEMMKFRKKLPSFDMRDNILQVIRSNQVVVLSGETGCGKTTQVPQFILDEIIENKAASTCRIICTQPRRIAAITVAKRVADERNESLGLSVGYQIRLEKILPRSLGSILYCTTGIVLQWLQSDSFLSEISHLIIDEVHERDTLSDFLICITKYILPYRPDLKVILMSATINAEKFSQYFGNCPKIHIPGYTFPVTEWYLEDVIEKLRFSYINMPIRRSNYSSLEDVLPKFDKLVNYSSSTINELKKQQSEIINYDLIVEVLRFINRQGPGAVLVFLSGWDEISSINKLLEKDPEFGNDRCLVIPLHSMMPTANQKEVFNTPPEGIRKIVLATNIAETSITIDDVVYVIDSGKIKITNYNKESKVASLKPEWVALANARQRRGRAGRVKAGICYHLYSRARESLFEDTILPEIQRTRLEEVVLNVKILQLGLCEEFLSKIMEPPDNEVLQISLKLLKSINALDTNENLTPLGYHLARMPVDPFIGKMLLTATVFSCVSPILTIAAVLAFKNPFIIPLNREKDVDRLKKILDDNMKSDHILLITIYDKWLQATNRRDHGFEHRHFLSRSVMYQIRKLRKDFMEILHNHNFTNTSDPYAPEINRNSANVAVVKAVITAGLYPNVARAGTATKRRRKFFNGLSTPDGNVHIHMKSVNCYEREFETEWMVYWEKMRTDKVYLYDTTMVDNLPLLLFGEKLDYDHKFHCINIDNFFKIKCDKNIYAVIQKLRKELDSLFEYKLNHPSAANCDPSSKEHQLLKLITSLLKKNTYN